MSTCVQVAAGEAREYGHAMVSRIPANQAAGKELLGKLPDTTKMWMSHGDKLTAVPEVYRYIYIPRNTYIYLCFIASKY